MAQDQKALRQQCDNLEHGITTITGTQQTLSHDLRGFMQQLGPLLSLAQQQALPPQTNGGAASPAPTAATPTPTAAPPPTPLPAESGGGAALPGGDTNMAFAPIRQPATSHGGPYSPN